VVFGAFHFDHDIVNRSNWREKSDVTMEREEEAQKRLDAFVEESFHLPSTAFPLAKDPLRLGF